MEYGNGHFSLKIGGEIITIRAAITQADSHQVFQRMERKSLQVKASSLRDKRQANPQNAMRATDAVPTYVCKLKQEKHLYACERINNDG